MLYIQYKCIYIYTHHIMEHLKNKTRGFAGKTEDLNPQPPQKKGNTQRMMAILVVIPGVTSGAWPSMTSTFTIGYTY